MRRPHVALLPPLALALCVLPVKAQTFSLEDPVLRRIWQEGMEHSQLYPLAQTLLDSIGPRLAGSPGIKAGNDWLVATYGGWGVAARNEQFGTWKGWRRGISHVDLIAPRVRTLEATMLAWSPGTKRAEGKVMILPDVADSNALAAWLPQAKNAFVAISFPQPTCRPDTSWATWTSPESYTRMKAARDTARLAWNARLQRTGYSARELPKRLEQAGIRGILTNNWSAGWGVDKIFDARTEKVPTVDLSCEDYGLVFRLAERNQGPVLRMEAEAEFLGEVPVYNTIAEIKGSEKPDEYVMLSAHFDSWDGGSGATDNGTGTLTMLEAMRILKLAYPAPKRTIVVGHWSSEEQGLIGSRAFAADHQEMVNGLQALFNQDNGTGRVANLSMQGLVNAGGPWGRWLSRLPAELTRNVSVQFPGVASGGGTDNASFICYGAPAFGLGSLNADYGQYTWHTNRDTFDKLMLDDVKNNATLTAMLVYLASEDPDRVSRDRRALFPPNPFNNQPGSWPACQPAARSSAESAR
jgi:hypothetical protein